MNRHARRGAKAHTPGERHRHSGAVREDAGFLRELVFVDQTKLLNLMHAAAGGDTRAMVIARAFARVFAETMKAAKTTRPKLCMSCPKELTDLRFSVMLAVPKRDEATKIIGAAMCTDCGLAGEGVAQKAASALRAIWPDLRLLRITHHDGGRA